MLFTNIVRLLNPGRRRLLLFLTLFSAPFRFRIDMLTNCVFLTHLARFRGMGGHIPNLIDPRFARVSTRWDGDTELLSHVDVTVFEIRAKRARGCAGIIL